MSTRDNEFFFGSQKNHCAWSEGVDVAHIAWNGDVSGADVTDGAKIFELVPNNRNGFFLVIHVENQGTLHPQARQNITTDPRSQWVRAVLVVGANFQVRVVFGMLTKAINALKKGSAPTFFISPDTNLVEHLAELRQRYPDGPRSPMHK
jgi:hypothetical protein